MKNNRILLYTQKALVITTIVASALVLTGCGKKQTATSSKNKIVLNVWRTFDDDLSFTQAIASYEKAHPEVTINYSKKDIADYETQSLSALAAGTGPDIWSIPNEWMERQRDKLIPMPDGFTKTNKDQRDNETFYKDTWAAVTVPDNLSDHKIYGIPLYVDTLALYVNPLMWAEAKDAYRKANQTNPQFDDSLFRHPPATWNELLDELPYLTKKDAAGNITQAGIALGTSNNVPFSADILSLLMLQNGTIMTDQSQKSARFNTYQNDSSNKPVYNGTSALTFYTNFAKLGSSAYTWNSDQENALKAFMDGKVAIMVAYEYVAQALYQQTPTLKYDIVPMPQVKGAAVVNHASYWTETVTNNAKRPEYAWDFVLTIGAQPSSYLSATKRPPALKLDAQSSSYNVFDTQTRTAQTWPKGKYPEKVKDVLSSMINDVVVKNQPAQAAIDNAATTTTELLRKP